jgi:nicotinate phosphoribosyltransferase
VSDAPGSHDPRIALRFEGDPGDSLLLTDLYQLNMLQAYRDAGMTATAVFEFFIRKLPAGRGFLIAAGLEQVVEFLERARFGEAELTWLEASGRFNRDLLDDLARWRFTGDVHAMPEGTAFFPDEPILRVTAPLPEAQLIESRIINILHFQTLIASKAARMVLAAPGKRLVDFGLRRAHGAEAGLMAARASYLAGFAGSATTLAEPRFGVPIFGTMAHSFIQAHDDEESAFLSFARSRPEHTTLLIDTYDTEEGARKVVGLVPRLKEIGIEVRAVRLDSGDLAEHARRVRAIFDEAGLHDVTIFASGGLDEHMLQRYTAESVPIDGYGIGTSLTTSQDAPALDSAYKLQEYAGVPKRKRSEGKATWPGRKQVWRRYDDDTMAGDLLTLEDDPALTTSELKPLIVPVMRGGRRIGTLPSLAQVRERAAAELQHLPQPLRMLEANASYPVTVSDALRALARAVDKPA